MTIIINSHARERLTERLGVSERKLEKVAHKAWNSTEKIPNHRNQKLRRAAEEHPDELIQWRRLMGWDFIFSVKKNGDIHLITILGGGRESRGVEKKGA